MDGVFNHGKDVRKFIDEITPGLYSLKKTYPDTKEMVAKVDSIILCLCDFKDKTEDYIKQKNKEQTKTINLDPIKGKMHGPEHTRGIDIKQKSPKEQP